MAIYRFAKRHPHIVSATLIMVFVLSAMLGMAAPTHAATLGASAPHPAYEGGGGWPPCQPQQEIQLPPEPEVTPEWVGVTHCVGGWNMVDSYGNFELHGSQQVIIVHDGVTRLDSWENGQAVTLCPGDSRGEWVFNNEATVHTRAGACVSHPAQHAAGTPSPFDTAPAPATTASNPVATQVNPATPNQVEITTNAPVTVVVNGQPVYNGTGGQASQPAPQPQPQAQQAPASAPAEDPAYSCNGHRVDQVWLQDNVGGSGEGWQPKDGAWTWYHNGDNENFYASGEGYLDTWQGHDIHIGPDTPKNHTDPVAKNNQATWRCTKAA